MHDADLSEADLSDASLRECDLSLATVRGTNLTNTDLPWSTVGGVDLSTARLHQTQLSVAGAVTLAESCGALVDANVYPHNALSNIRTVVV